MFKELKNLLKMNQNLINEHKNSIDLVTRTIKNSSSVIDLNARLIDDNAEIISMVKQMFVHPESFKETEKMMQIAKAVIYLTATDELHDLTRYLKNIDGELMLPDGDGAYDIKLIDWWKSEVSND